MNWPPQRDSKADISSSSSLLSGENKTYPLYSLLVIQPDSHFLRNIDAEFVKNNHLEICI